MNEEIEKFKGAEVPGDESALKEIWGYLRDRKSSVEGDLCNNRSLGDVGVACSGVNCRNCILDKKHRNLFKEYMIKKEGNEAPCKVGDTVKYTRGKDHYIVVGIDMGRQLADLQHIVSKAHYPTPFYKIEVVGPAPLKKEEAVVREEIERFKGVKIPRNEGTLAEAYEILKSGVLVKDGLCSYTKGQADCGGISCNNCIFGSEHRNLFKEYMESPQVNIKPVKEGTKIMSNVNELIEEVYADDKAKDMLLVDEMCGDDLQKTLNLLVLTDKKDGVLALAKKRKADQIMAENK
ncbi:hypothetical protein KAR91_03940 [Candidatus Pacearchaeota archaeon]|nr:hypothetical protein [Candidatus Pacearchaeota archaeon]